jgi:hypothetical protein
MKKEVHPFSLAEGYIFGKRTGILREILVRAKLLGIYKNGDDHTPLLTTAIGKSSGPTNE